MKIAAHAFVAEFATTPSHYRHRFANPPSPTARSGTSGSV